MGMYTELIFGAELLQETPQSVIAILKHMCDGAAQPTELPKHPFFACPRWSILLTCGSYYFGVHHGPRKFWYDDVCNSWHISTRSNIKNYSREIEEFLDWVAPWIAQGSGLRGMYAVVIYEEGEPQLYFLAAKGEVA